MKKTTLERTYKAEYEDDEIEVFTADNDDEAYKYAVQQETDHGTLWYIDELSDDYDVIRTVF